MPHTHACTTVHVCRPFTDPLAGPLQNPRLCLYRDDSNVQFSWQVYFKTLQRGVYTCLSDIHIYLDQLLPTSKFVVCPGIRDYPEEIRFRTKNLVQWGEPFSRMFSAACDQWHIPNNARQSPTSAAYNCCKPCKQLVHDIRQLQQKAGETTEGTKVSRTLTSSNYPISKLSPTSQSKRISKLTDERKNLTKKLNKLQPFDCIVNDKEHANLLELVSTIHKKGSKAIRELISEGEQILGPDNNALQQAWHQDVTERLEYERDQRRSGMNMGIVIGRGRSSRREMRGVGEEMKVNNYMWPGMYQNLFATCT